MIQTHRFLEEEGWRAVKRTYLIDMLEMQLDLLLSLLQSVPVFVMYRGNLMQAAQQQREPEKKGDWLI